AEERVERERGPDGQSDDPWQPRRRREREQPDDECRGHERLDAERGGVLSVEAGATETVATHLAKERRERPAGLVAHREAIALERREARSLDAPVELDVLARVEGGVERPDLLEHL